jgi:FHA domain/Double zinc ribbon
MTTYPCPNGHASAADDYCDTCGAPIAAASTLDAPAAAGVGAERPATPAAPSSGGGEPAAAGAVTCPSCSTDNPAGSLFCEACGYDFTTGTMPRPPDGEGSPGALDLGPASPAQRLDASAAGRSAPGAPGALDGSDAPKAPDGSQASPAPQASAVPPEPAAPPVAPPVPVQWVTEVWVDPDWYDAQESEEACPSPGLPAVVPLSRRSVLVGRPSASRSIHPDIDCSGDIGVSRRQAQLTTDGQRWWVEDLQSANGTYVGAASGPLPTSPLPPGQRHELAEDDRIYLGAWTRLVVRRATPEEQNGSA